MQIFRSIKEIFNEIEDIDVVEYEKGNVYVVDLMWEYEKTILLLPDKKDIYNRIKNSKDFNIFCLDQTFDTDEFIKSLRR